MVPVFSAYSWLLPSSLLVMVIVVLAMDAIPRD
jgi:hypothetical protein